VRSPWTRNAERVAGKEAAQKKPKRSTRIRDPIEKERGLKLSEKKKKVTLEVLKTSPSILTGPVSRGAQSRMKERGRKGGGAVKGGGIKVLKDFP